MKPLDPIQERLFPSLATYVRRVRWEEAIALILTVLSAYIIGRDILSAYQSRVATENMLAVVTRVNEIEAQCQKEYTRRFVITKAAAQVSAAKREEERRKP